MFGWESGDGIFSPGGSTSNMYGLNCAKYNMFPHLKESGFFGQKELVMFTSDMVNKAETSMRINKNESLCILL